MKLKLFCTIFLLIFIAKSAVCQIVGGDVDAHGCKSSAGYTFSIIKNDCIRLWMEEIRLSPTNNGKAGFFAAVIFSKDKKRAEVFIPEFKSGIILNKMANTNKYVFKKDSLELIVQKGYILKKANKVIYTTNAIEHFEKAKIINPINIHLQDSGKVFKLKLNEKFDVTLTECVGCRYVWSIAEIDKSKISFFANTYSNKTACEGCTGGNQDNTFHFSAKAKGKSTIALIYFKQKFTITIEAD